MEVAKEQKYRGLLSQGRRLLVRTESKLYCITLTLCMSNKGDAILGQHSQMTCLPGGCKVLRMLAGTLHF